MASCATYPKDPSASGGSLWHPSLFLSCSFLFLLSFERPWSPIPLFALSGGLRLSKWGKVQTNVRVSSQSKQGNAQRILTCGVLPDAGQGTVQSGPGCPVTLYQLRDVCTTIPWWRFSVKSLNKYVVHSQCCAKLINLPNCKAIPLRIMAL